MAGAGKANYQTFQLSFLQLQIPKNATADCLWHAAGDSIPANQSRFATPAAREAAMRKAKEAALSRLPPNAMGVQSRVMAMRMGEEVTQGTEPGMEVATTTGNDT